jgi:CDP-diacylglycerol--glycerol-3-phosphate 3-phosphatidyltransferase
MAEAYYPRDSSLIILKRKSVYLGIASAALLTSGYFLLRVLWSSRFAGQWTLLTAGGFVYLFYIFRKLIPLNSRPGSQDRILSDLGPATVLTISRGLLVSMLAGFLFSPWAQGGLAWLPAILYWLANLTDFLDGYVARRTDYETQLGAALDMALDGYGVLVAAILVVQFGQIPVWYLPVGLARYLFLIGIWARKRAGGVINPLPPSIRRRAFAGLQMGFLGIMLMPLFAPPGTFWAAGIFSAMFLSGFAIDWLYISGAVTPASIKRIIKTYATPLYGAILVLRLTTAGLLAWTIADRISIILFNKGTLPGLEMGLAAGIWGLPILVDGLLLILVLTGSMGRLAALAILVLLGFYQLQAPLTLQQLFLILASAGTFFLGTGPLSLWTPEDRLIYHRAGEL